jgi:hypothetical protein
MTALLFASAGGHVDMVRWLVREADIDLRRERAKVWLWGIKTPRSDNSVTFVTVPSRAVWAIAARCGAACSGVA